MATEPKQARTAAEIEADIERTRLRLQGTIDTIAARVKPSNVARRGAATAKAQVVDAEGAVRTVRVVALAAVGAALVGLALLHRRRGR
jgi:hypothetical protein